MEYSKKKIEYTLVTSACHCGNKGALELYKIEMIFEYEFQESTGLHLVMIEVHRDNLIICNTFLSSYEFLRKFLYRNAISGEKKNFLIGDLRNRVFIKSRF